MVGGMKTPLALVLALALAALAPAATTSTVVEREVEETDGNLKYSWKMEVIEDEAGGRWVFTKSVFNTEKLTSVEFAQTHIATGDLFYVRSLAEKAREWDVSCQSGMPSGFEKDLPKMTRVRGRFHWLGGFSMTRVEGDDFLLSGWWSRKDLDAYISFCAPEKLKEMVVELRKKADGAKDFAKTLK